VKPNEYREVQVTPLVGGVVKEVPVVLGDHVKRGQPLAIIFSSELAEAETQYVSYLASLTPNTRNSNARRISLNSEQPANRKKRKSPPRMPRMKRMCAPLSKN